jgi:hypothetical protein
VDWKGKWFLVGARGQISSETIDFELLIAANGIVNLGFSEKRLTGLFSGDFLKLFVSPHA